MVTNNTGISLAMAVWLVHDEYDYINEENYISATSLMKPLRHIVLPRRIPAAERTAPDIADFTARSLGHSLHDSIEKAWVKGYRKNLTKLGYPPAIIDRVAINPTPEEVKARPDMIPVYLEQRTIRSLKIGNITYRIGGKYDMVAEGIVHDNKSTSAYTWLHGTRDDEHALQGSIYRWLNPGVITEDFIRINYIFTDWQKMLAKSNPKYPQARLQAKDIPLLSLAQTEAWIINKMKLIEAYMNVPEPQVPECTDEELWRSEPVYKYYSDPSKTTGRSTKNFDTPQEARVFMTEKGGKGIVITVPGEPKRCGYCDAFDICTQKDKFQP
jgi:hypothetical protein